MQRWLFAGLLLPFLGAVGSAEAWFYVANVTRVVGEAPNGLYVQGANAPDWTGFIQKRSLNEALLWSAPVTRGNLVASSRAAGVYVVEKDVFDGNTPVPWRLTRFDAATGAAVWRTTLDMAPEALVATPGGDVLISGRVAGDTADSIDRIAPDGTRRWRGTAGFGLLSQGLCPGTALPSTFRATTLKVDANGDVLAAVRLIRERCPDSPPAEALFVKKLDGVSAAQSWLASIGGNPGGAGSVPVTMEVSKAGDVLVSAKPSSGSFTQALAREDGSLRWNRPGLFLTAMIAADHGTFYGATGDTSSIRRTRVNDGSDLWANDGYGSSLVAPYGYLGALDAAGIVGYDPADGHKLFPAGGNIGSFGGTTTLPCGYAVDLDVGSYVNVRRPLPALLCSGTRGDLDGDQNADLVWQHTDGRMETALMSGVETGQNLLVLGPGAWTATHRGDFDGDGRSDVVLKNSAGGISIFLMAGSGPSATQDYATGTSWNVTHVADFEGVGKSGLLWEHTDGSVAMWLMNGLAQTAGIRLLGPGTGWHAHKVADFNGDGKADILWRHNDGSTAVWLMNGTTQIGGARLLGVTPWIPKVVGDFDGDGKADIVWQHTDGSVAMWTMDGATQRSGARLLDAGTGYTPTFAGDFDGDGKADILWERSNGQSAIWFMNGTVLHSARALRAAGTGFTVQSLGDFNGDGKTDIVWKAGDGSTEMWLIDWLKTPAMKPLRGAGSGWMPVP